MTGFYFVHVPRHMKWVQVCWAENHSSPARVVLDFLDKPALAADIAMQLNLTGEQP